MGIHGEDLNAQEHHKHNIGLLYLLFPIKYLNEIYLWQQILNE